MMTTNKTVLGQTLYVETSEDCKLIIDNAVRRLYSMLQLDENGKGKIGLSKLLFDFLDEFGLPSDNVSLTLRAGLLKYVLIQMIYEDLKLEKVEFLISYSGSVINCLSTGIDASFFGVQTTLHKGCIVVSNALTKHAANNLKNIQCESAIAISSTDHLLQAANASILLAIGEYINAMTYSENVDTMYLSVKDKCFYKDDGSIVKSTNGLPVFDVMQQLWN